MTSRTRRTVIRFASPFRLAGISHALPAGRYEVDHDEESIDGPSWIAWHNVGTFLHLPAIGRASLQHQMLAVDAVDLQEALKRDEQNETYK